MRSGKYYKTREERYNFRVFLASEYNDGKTINQIGKEINLAERSIYKHLKKINVIMRKTMSLRGVKEKLILELTRKGLTKSEISKKVGVKLQTVRNTQKRHNLYKYPFTTTCKEKSCKAKHHGRGFCIIHYGYYYNVKKDLEMGLSQKQIAKKRPSVSHRFITQYFPQQRHYHANKLLLSTLYDCGGSLRQIAEIYNCSNYIIKYHLTKMGIKLRDRGGPNRLKWKGKKIPCSECGESYAMTKGLCARCYNRKLNAKLRRDEIWRNMNEHRVMI